MNRVSIGSDNSLAPDRWKAIIWTNAGLLPIRPLGRNLNKILIKIQNFSFTKMHLKISSVKWQPFCPGRDELTWTGKNPNVVKGSHTYLSITNVSGPWFNIKISSYQYRKSHCGDKTVVRPSYLHNGISYTGKMVSLYWISPLLLTQVIGRALTYHGLIIIFLPCQGEFWVGVTKAPYAHFSTGYIFYLYFCKVLGITSIFDRYIIAACQIWMRYSIFNQYSNYAKELRK